MEFLNDRRVIKEISDELGISPSLTEEVVSSFFGAVAKEIENSKEDIDNGIEKIIEIKHLGKFITNKKSKNGRLRTN